MNWTVYASVITVALIISGTLFAIFKDKRYQTHESRICVLEEIMERIEKKVDEFISDITKRIDKVINGKKK